jgi:DNA-binding transcriptional LysR family regulator
MGKSLNRLRVGFHAQLPVGRWAPLFQVLVLEQPGLTFEWTPNGFPTGPLLEGADVGLFLEPPLRDGLSALTLDASPMVVAMAVGHPLTQHDELRVVDILDEAFPGGPGVEPGWAAFWTLDEQRGAPATRTDDAVSNPEQGFEVVASGRAIATIPRWLAASVSHPGVVTCPCGMVRW